MSEAVGAVVHNAASTAPRRALIRGGASLTLLLAAALVTLVALSPILFTIAQAFQVTGDEAVTLLFRPLVGQLLVNTIVLVGAASVTCAILGTTTAWLVERTNLPGRRVWAVLAAAPMAVPPFIASYAWVSLSNALQDFAGALLVVTCAYYPLIYLPVAAALRGLDPALEEVAQACGLGPWRCFFQVTLPQLRPALYGGILLVALDTLIEFGALALLRFRTFTTELYAQYRTGFDGPEASLLALVLLALCLTLLVAELRVRGGASYARVGAGVRRIVPRAGLSWFKWPVLIGMAALVVASLGVPIGMVVYWLLQHAAAATSAAAPSTTAIVGATLTSLGYGLAGAIVALVLAAPLAYLSVRHPSPLATTLERASYLAMGAPGIVVALSFISLSVQFLRPLYQSAALLVLAYAILFLPLALVGIRSALAQAPRRLEEAARSLGAGWVGVTLKVLVPLTGPGLGGSAAMVFGFVITELSATLLLSPIGTRTLATEVWANSSALAFAAAAPFAGMMLAISLGSVWFFARRFGATAFFEGGGG